MVFWASTGMLNAYLNNLITNTTRMIVCSTSPNASSQASSSGGNAALAWNAFSSADWALANSTVTNAQKITSSEVSGVTVKSSGVANHVALYNASSSAINFVTECTTKALTTSDTVTIPAWSIHLLQPSSST